ncbi:MAG: hypothetical protein HZC40_16665 [Chloroflexi bacterium]|nr:hypothetical protein [Chloroflexota bacterium]
MQTRKRLTQLCRPIGLLIIFLMVLSCRTTDLIRQFADNHIGAEKISADIEPVQDPTPPETATPRPVGRLEHVIASTTQVAGPIPAERTPLAPTAIATPTWMPILQDLPPATRAPVRAPAKTATPTKILATLTPRFQYQVSFSWCGPNWLTFIEGTVTQGGQAKDGLLIRIALDPDGSALVSDYKTGTDPTKPGGYTQIIDANAPHGGLWYLWIVDPQTHKRISAIATVKTDPKRIEETSCQSANINFSD